MLSSILFRAFLLLLAICTATTAIHADDLIVGPSVAAAGDTVLFSIPKTTNSVVVRKQLPAESATVHDGILRLESLQAGSYVIIVFDESGKHYEKTIRLTTDQLSTERQRGNRELAIVNAENQSNIHHASFLQDVNDNELSEFTENDKAIFKEVVAKRLKSSLGKADSNFATRNKNAYKVVKEWRTIIEDEEWNSDGETEVKKFRKTLLFDKFKVLVEDIREEDDAVADLWLEWRDDIELLLYSLSVPQSERPNQLKELKILKEKQKNRFTKRYNAILTQIQPAVVQSNSIEQQKAALLLIAEILESVADEIGDLTPPTSPGGGGGTAFSSTTLPGWYQSIIAKCHTCRHSQ